jgi:hypothetical protein
MPDKLNSLDLWKLLVAGGYRGACYGLLLDLFEAVDWGKFRATKLGDTEVGDATTRTAERLMVILGDLNHRA